MKGKDDKFGKLSETGNCGKIIKNQRTSNNQRKKWIESLFIKLKIPKEIITILIILIAASLTNTSGQNGATKLPKNSCNNTKIELNSTRTTTEELKPCLEVPKGDTNSSSAANTTDTDLNENKDDCSSKKANCHTYIRQMINFYTKVSNDYICFLRLYYIHYPKYTFFSTED